jgi:putative flavoprotein involved in K+ transport
VSLDMIEPARSSAGRHPPLDVLVIGGGQAGLALARELALAKISYLVVDENDRIGCSWRARWDGLRLFSPRHYNSLPGLPMPGDPDGYPDKDEAADYLARYAADLDANIRLRSQVIRLDRINGRFRAAISGGHVLTARAIVVATGPFQVPVVPENLAAGLSSEVRQLHASTFDLSSVKSGRTLIVGGGASGRQIARLLAEEREVWLAKRSAVLVQPQRVLGRDMMYWMDLLGFLWAGPRSLRGRMAASIEAFPGPEYSDGALKVAGIRIVGAARATDGRNVTFDCGAKKEFDSVVWATGYRTDDSWIALDGATENSVGVHSRGISPVPGLFYIGRSFQSCRASALMCGVGRDAHEVSWAVKSYLERT